MTKYTVSKENIREVKVSTNLSSLHIIALRAEAQSKVRDLDV